MASPSFFNENESRTYPFVVGVETPPHALVVDCGFVARVKSRFETDIHSIYLAAIRRVGSYFYLDFTSDAPELYGERLTFSRHVADSDFATEFVSSGSAGLSESSESGSDSQSDDCFEPLWEGFVVTGRIAAFVALLPTDAVIDYTAVVEPALIHNLSETYVAKIGLANNDRTRVTAAEGCEVQEFDEVLRINRSCLLGDVVFKPGYNANVRQSLQDNSITLGAAVGDGAGQPCDTIPLYPGETPPEGSTLLEGGPRCNETVRALNGLGGPLLTILAGHGVTVTSSPDDNRVIVNVNMTGLALCYDSLSERSESC